MMGNHFPRMIAALLMIAQFGCMVGPKYRPPSVSPPQSFRGTADETTSVAPSFGDQKWWDVFQDTQLQALIRTALQQNYDVRIAAARILEAQAQVGIAKSNEFPSVGVILNVNDIRYARSKFLSPYTTSFTELGLGFDWNLDFWGKYRSATESARAQLLAEDWARQEVVNTTVSGIASAYFKLRELDMELQISRQTLESNNDSLKLTQMLFDGGATSLLDVRQAEQSVFEASAAIPIIEKAIEQQENLIESLLGESPGGVERGTDITAQLHTPDIPAGLPSSLLERRPDIRESEARLKSRNAEIGVARAAYFPSLSLTSTSGFQSIALTRLFTGPAGVWSFVGSLTQPLFNFGALKRNVQFTEAEQQEAVLSYRQTIQQAFREVSDALIAYAKDQEFRKQQELLTAAAADASRLSDLRYKGGSSSYLEVLDSNTRHYAAKLTLAQAQLRELLDYVEIYRALGGGWQQ